MGYLRTIFIAIILIIVIYQKNISSKGITIFQDKPKLTLPNNIQKIAIFSAIKASEDKKIRDIFRFHLNFNNKINNFKDDLFKKLIEKADNKKKETSISKFDLPYSIKKDKPTFTHYKNSLLKKGQFFINQIRNDFEIDFKIINDFSAKPDFKGAKQYANQFKLDELRNMLIKLLIDEKFTNEGVLKKFEGDPFWKNLTNEQKEFFTDNEIKLESNRTRFDALNSILEARYNVKTKLAFDYNWYFREKKFNDCISEIEEYLAFEFNSEINNLLYQLIDLDLKSKDNLLLKFAEENRNNSRAENYEHFYFFFSGNGILKHYKSDFVNKLYIKYDPSYPLRFEDIKFINDLLFLDANSTNENKFYIKKVKEFILYCCNNKNHFYIKYLLEFCKLIIEALLKNDLTTEISNKTLYKIKLNPLKNTLKINKKIGSIIKLLDKLKPKQKKRIYELRKYFLINYSNKLYFIFNKSYPKNILDKMEILHNKLLSYEITDINRPLIISGFNYLYEANIANDLENASKFLKLTNSICKKLKRI